MSFLAGLIAGVALALIAAFLRKADAPKADRWLIVLLLTLGIIASILGHAAKVPDALLVLAGGPLFMVPPACLLLYVRHLTGHQSILEWSALLPGLIWGAALLSGVSGAGSLPAVFPIIASLAFPLIAWITIERYRRRLLNTYSTVRGIDLGWLRWTVMGVAAGTLAGAAFSMVPLFFDSAGSDEILALILGIVFLQLSLATFFGLYQRGLPPLSDLAAVNEERSGEFERLNVLMKQTRAFLDPDFRIDDLARSAGRSARAVSGTINSQPGLNFFRFVNGFRVAEARRLLADEAWADRPIIDIAFEAGFQSKASFNRVFKEVTGEVPGAYRRTRNGRGED